MLETSAAIAKTAALTKTYPKGVRALDGLGFSVEAGTVFGLLGPNGMRQVDHRQDPHHPDPARRRPGQRGRD